MTFDQTTGNIRTPQIALVGTTRAGKSVFTTVLAKYLERKQEGGVRLSPRGGTPKSTYAQIDEWWNALQTGNWLPATTPGTLIELQWDLCVQDKKIPLRMFDYAGETLTDLFSGRKDDAVGAAKEFFDKVRSVFESASVLLVLINLESFIEKDVSSVGESKGTLVTAMSTFLEKLKRDGRSCRVCFVFTAYDQYKPLILSKWGSVKNFLEQEIPPLYYEFVDEQSDVKVLPVAAVSETETRVDPHDGRTLRYPKAGFRALGFDPLVKWLVEAVGNSKEELDAKAIDAAQDEQNTKFVEWFGEAWKAVSSADQLVPIDRFLEEARKNVPFPQRPNAAKLDLQRLAHVNAAVDLRAKVLERIARERRVFLTSVLKIGLPVLAAIVLIPLILMYVSSAYKKRVELQIAAQQAEAERLKIPRPVINGDANWQYTCNTGVFDCWEHRAMITVPVKNEGGAGNVTVTFKLGGRTNSKTTFFNQDEISTVYLTINDLPNHTSNDASVTAKASQ